MSININEISPYISVGSLILSSIALLMTILSHRNSLQFINIDYKMKILIKISEVRSKTDYNRYLYSRQKDYNKLFGSNFSNFSGDVFYDDSNNSMEKVEEFIRAIPNKITHKVYLSIYNTLCYQCDSLDTNRKQMEEYEKLLLSNTSE